jgi:quinol monooxygenase YgiN
VIVRVFRACVVPGSEEAVHRAIREVGLPAVEAHDGLIAAHLGRRMAPEGEEFVIVSVWRDHEALGRELDEPLELGYLAEAARHLHGTTVDLYEAFEHADIATLSAGVARS